MIMTLKLYMLWVMLLAAPPYHGDPGGRRGGGRMIRNLRDRTYHLVRLVKLATLAISSFSIESCPSLGLHTRG